MHGQHERYKRMYAEQDAEHARGYDTHEFEVHLPDQGSGVYSWCERAEHADLVSDVGSLFLGQSDEGLSGPLRMADQTEFLKACLGKDSRYVCRQVHDTHLPNVPRPHSRVCVREHLVFWNEPTPIVAEPNIITAGPESACLLF